MTEFEQPLRGEVVAGCATHTPYYQAAHGAMQQVGELIQDGYEVADIRAMLTDGDEHLARACDTLAAIEVVADEAFADRAVLTRGKTSEIEPYAAYYSRRFVDTLDHDLDIVDVSAFASMHHTTMSYATGQIQGHRGLADPFFVKTVALQTAGHLLAYVNPAKLCSRHGFSEISAQQSDDAALRFRDAEEMLDRAGAQIDLSQTTLLHKSMEVQRRAVQGWHSLKLKGQSQEQLSSKDLDQLSDANTGLMKELARLRQYPMSSEKRDLGVAITTDRVAFHHYKSLGDMGAVRGGVQPMALIRFIPENAPDEQESDAPFASKKSPTADTSVFTFNNTNHLLTLDARGDLWLGISPDKDAVPLKLLHEVQGRSSEYELLRSAVLRRLFDAIVPTSATGFGGEDAISPLDETLRYSAFLRSHNAKALRKLLQDPSDRERGHGRRRKIAQPVGSVSVEGAGAFVVEDAESGADIPEIINSDDIPSVEESKVALELQRLLGNEAYKKLLAIEGSMGLAHTMARYQVLGTKLNSTRGKREGVISDDDVQETLEQHGDSLTLQALRDIHEMVYAMARVSGRSFKDFSSHVLSWDTTELVKALANDLGVLYHDGYEDGDEPGKHGNLMRAAMRMKAFNLVMLMDKRGSDMPYVQTLYKSLLDGFTSPDKRVQELAQQYSVELMVPTTNAANLSKILEQAGDEADEVVRRATADALINESYRHYTQMGDMSSVQKQFIDALHAMSELDEEDLKSLLAMTRELQKHGVSPGAVEEIIGAMQLNWEILPPGELHEAAKGIVDDIIASGTEVAIDLERLTALEKIRKAWGEDKCYYARGTLGKRAVVRKNGQEEPDKYLLLVMQEHDALGNVVAEHAVAESPITGKNAMFLFRQDVSEGLSWREVMALPKRYAEGLGARRLLHTTVKSGAQFHMPTAMATKVNLLMACTPDEFPLAVFNGDRGIRIKTNKAS